MISQRNEHLDAQIMKETKTEKSIISLNHFEDIAYPDRFGCGPIAGVDIMWDLRGM